MNILHKTTGAILKTVDGANLEGANMRGANLKDADLRGANMRGAIILGTDLDGADLRGANLDGADLRGVNLRHADFRGTGVRVWQLWHYQWILTATHVHAGCIRIPRPDLCDVAALDWPESGLTPDQVADANAVLAVMLTLKC